VAKGRAALAKTTQKSRHPSINGVTDKKGVAVPKILASTQLEIMAMRFESRRTLGLQKPFEARPSSFPDVNKMDILALRSCNHDTRSYFTYFTCILYPAYLLQSWFQ
jgi:hypothetical protein